MPSQSFRIGVAGTTIFKTNTTVLPAASGVGFTVSAITPTTPYTLNDIKKPLDTGVNYQVILAFLGSDTVNGGYTITVGSSASPPTTVSTGQGLYVRVPAANLPNAASNTPAIACFLKAGNGNYTLAEFAYLNVNSGADFDHVIFAKPLTSAPGNFTAALLQSASSDAVLGSRSTVGWDQSTLQPTTGGVTVTRSVTQVSVSPDNSADFNIVTTRTAEISFQLLANDILDVVQGNAGDFIQYTATSGKSIQESQMSLNTAAALIAGNNPMTLLMPPDSQNNQEIRLYLGQLLQNQTQNTEAWTKSATTPISYTYSAVSIDKLIISEHTEISFKTS
jgi:hypothetical protein